MSSPSSFKQLQIHYLPNVGVIPLEQIDVITQDSVSDRLQAAASGAVADKPLVSRLNRITNIAHDTGAVLTVSIANGGTGSGAPYALWDHLHVTKSGGGGCTLWVTAIGSGADAGKVASVSMLYRGRGYSAANGLATSTDSIAGAGCTVNILSVGGDTVRLPAALAGLSILVRNDSSATGLTLPVVDGNGTNYKVGNLIYPTQVGGSGGVLRVAMVDGSGTPTFLAVEVPGSSYTTAANSIPTTTNSAAGSGLTIGFTQGSQALIVYPYSGDAINALAANALYTLAAGKEIVFRCYTAGTWIGAVSN